MHSLFIIMLYEGGGGCISDGTKKRYMIPLDIKINIKSLNYI